MTAAELPEDEYDRLGELHDLELLDSPPQERFERITRLAQRTFGTKIAAFSLVDEHRQFFMSRIGLEPRETPRDQAFCAHAILDDDVLVVRDALQDERFHDNPLVTGDPTIRFYAGAPVRTETGHALGTLCVIDSAPREWTDEDSAALADLANLVERELGTSRRQARHEALVALTAISSLRSDDLQDLIRQALQVACDYLEVPEAWIIRLVDEEPHVRIANTEHADVAEGTRILIHEIDPFVFLDPDRVEVVAGLGPWAVTMGTGIAPAGETFGSLVFLSPYPRSYGGFTTEETDFVRLLARWVEGILDKAAQEAALAQRSSLLGVIRRAQARFIASTDRSEAFDNILSDVLGFTGCEYGFIAERLLDEQGSPYLRTRALTNIAWNDESRRLYEESRGTGMVFDNPHTLFGITMITGEAVIANDPATDPRSGGRPGQHPTLDSYLGLPLSIGEELVGVIGLANSPVGFTERDVAHLEPLTTTLAQLITVVRAQEAYRADQAEIARLSTVVRQMSTGVVITDLDGRIGWANAAFEQMLGYSLDELAGLRPRDVFHGPGTDPVAEETIREAMDRREPFAVELRVRRRDDEVFWVAIDSTPLVGDSGDVEGYVVLVDDITERRRVERMKSEFISTVSHELRTPLTSISGALALVASGSVGELSTRAQRMVSIAQENSQRLTLLINDLLDLERLVEGGLPIQVEQHPLMRLVERSVVDNQAYATRFGATIEIRSWIDDAIVLVDSVRFIQVMSNLLSNAAKYSPSGGVVSVDVQSDDDDITVEISDDGPGVPEDFRDRIFDKFAQADSTDSRARAGTGLGLAISKELVERMGGTIGYRARPGSGSTFWFSLPQIAERRRGLDRRAR
jgi:PAS domain S-box-containing protein